jgi:uncharacterized SAM-binding protein YcdF (DUF218 family)
MFILKKIISAFLLPIPILIFLFLLSFVFLLKSSYKKAKITLFIAIVWLLLISNQTISNLALAPLENQYPALLETPLVNYILVLGNLHISDEKLSISSEVKSTAVNRLVEGVRHYKNLKSKQKDIKLIVSGYSFDDINSHAQKQKELALALGVEEDDIITLHTPKDTKEEAIETKKIVNDEKIILITSASHMKRASLLFIKNGLNIIPSPTEHKTFYTSYPSAYFNSRNIEKFELAFHEYLGMLYSKLKGEI